MTKQAEETIKWIDVSRELPDAGSEVLVCYERNDCMERDVTIAEYDDGYEDESPWRVGGHLFGFGIVMYWAAIPAGPQRSCPK